MAASPGTVLGTYEIRALIGAGGMGEVYQARDTKLGRDVAIKVLPERFASDSDRLGRFQREAKLLASLNHPNIATIHGLEVSGETHYLVMELVPGPTLREKIAQEGAVPAEEALKIAKQIAEALEAAHGSEKGIIHRDLKPANVKVTPDGRVKVLDFGLAKAFAAEPTVEDIGNSPTLSAMPTMQGVIMGTAAYMSPEQARGKAVTKATDIWAFGAVLYEMLTGKPAFAGDDISDILAAVIRAEPDWSRLPAGTPASIRTLLRLCLRKERQQRFHDIADARIEIEQTLSAPAEATTIPTATTGWRQALVWAAVGILGVAAGIAGWIRRPAVEPAAVSRFAITLPEGQQFPALEPPVAISPDGRQLAYVGVRGGAQQLYLRAMNSLEAKEIAGTADTNAPFFSPDGQWIGFFAEGKLKKVPVSGGLPTVLAETSTSTQVGGGSWGPDDMIIFSPSFGSGLMQVPASGGKPRVLTTLDRSHGEFSHRFPQILPGGKAVLFSILTGDGIDDFDIGVLQLDSGQRQIVVHGGSSGRYVPTGHLIYCQGRNLLAVPFDLKTLKAASVAPTTIVEGVMLSTITFAEFAVSATGTLVYAPTNSTGNRNLVWVDRNGKTESLPAPPRSYTAPRLSPDGMRVAAHTEAADVLVYDLQRGTLTRAVAEGAFAIWTPDGKRLTYRPAREGTRNIFWKAADGTGSEERLTTGDNVQTPTSWSADGQVLLYDEANLATGLDVQLFHLGERKTDSLLRTPASEARARFSPDGHWVAYDSDESGRNEVYVRPYPGPGARLQISSDGGFDPMWNLNGRELFYRNGAKQMAVDVTTQPAFSAGRPRLLFQADFLLSITSRNYDVSRDGQRFLTTAPSEPELPNTRVNVVLNWFEELKGKVAAGK